MVMCREMGLNNLNILQLPVGRRFSVPFIGQHVNRAMVDEELQSSSPLHDESLY